MVISVAQSLPSKKFCALSCNREEVQAKDDVMREEGRRGGKTEGADGTRTNDITDLFIPPNAKFNTERKGSN